MPRKRHHKPLSLTEDERRTLEQWAHRPTTAQRLALRSRMVLACAEGLPNRAVATRLHVSSNSVCKWREGFRVRRLPGLTDEPRPGSPRKATDDRIVDVITRTLEGPPGTPHNGPPGAWPTWPASPRPRLRAFGRRLGWSRIAPTRSNWRRNL